MLFGIIVSTTLGNHILQKLYSLGYIPIGGHPLWFRSNSICNVIIIYNNKRTDLCPLYSLISYKLNLIDLR